MTLFTRYRDLVMVRRLALVMVAVGLFSVGIAAAQPAPSLSFRQLTIQDGLPAASVHRVLEDNQGFMWFGTRDGLVRYDGRGMRVFRPEVGDPQSMGDRRVNDLKEDAQSNLWVATDNGLDFWDRATERFVHFRANPTDPASLSHNTCWTVLPNPDGSIWVGTARGLNRFDSRAGTWEQFLPDRVVRCLLRDRKGMLWIGTQSGGLIQFDPQTGHFQPFPADANQQPSLSNGLITSLAEDGEGNLWIGTHGGLFRLDAKRHIFERYGSEAHNSSGLPTQLVDAVLVDRTGGVWVGMDGGGLSRFDPSTRRFVHHRHSRYATNTLTSDMVRSLYEDRQGDLWVGHFPAGISHANQLAAPFQVFRALPGDTNSLSDENAAAFWEDPSGDLWVGTDNGGLNHWEAATGRWKVYQHDPRNPGSLPSNSVLSVMRDRRGALWVGTWNGGLNRFEPATGTFRHYLPDATRAKALSNPHAWRLHEDRQGQLWVATAGGGIDRYVPEEDAFVHHRHNPADPSSLLNDYVWSLMEDRAGQLWAGTAVGLTRRDPTTGRWQHWPDTTGSVEALSRYPITDLLEDREGAIWACTHGAGLWRLDPRTGKVDGLRVAEGLPSEVTRGILEDDDGILWVSTNNGLARVDPRTRQVRTVDDHGGLPSRFFLTHARHRLRSGELVFGTTQGFVKFQPRAIQPNTNPPPVVLTDLEIFNQRVVPGAPESPLSQSLAKTRRLEIPARLSMLTFHFAVLNYRSPQLNRCLYQLEGFDKEWRVSSSDFRAIYNNLDPGRYRLRVKAANNDGVWNETGASLELIIVPPWWRTWWFRAVAVLLILGSAVRGGATISTRRTRARIIEMEKERQLAREREQAAEIVRESRQMLRIILDTIPVRVFWKDAALVYLGCNQPFARDAGLASVADVVGKDDFGMAWGVEQGNLYRADDQQVMASGEPKIGYEESQTRFDGRLSWVRTSKVPLRDLDGRVVGILGSYEDITEFKQAQTESEKLQNQLTQAQKIESIGRLAGGIAHDFNNMLQAIIGNAAIAMEEAADSPSIRESLDEIQKAARRSAELTRQLLTFARQQNIRPVLLDLNETVAGMLKMLQRLIDAHIRLTFTPGRNLWTVKIDPSQVDQLLANLVVNAHHAITGQGTITIVTANLTVDALYVESHAEAIPGDYVVLSVSDTGSGMTAETRAHLFEPFFTTKAVGKGTGLGLATVYGIVKQNQGFINVYSEPGQGAMFRIHLPRCAEAAARVAPIQQAAPPRGQETILLVEDEPQILIVCQRTLERLGYRVLTVNDPAAATAIIAAHPGEIHLLLSDVIMPTMNGYELLLTLRKTISGLRCVFMSGYASDTFTKQGIMPEGLNFLSKPFTAENLATTVRTALDQPA